MKLEIVKETKPIIGENGEDVWYWVKCNGDYGKGSKPFRTMKEAQSYYNAIKLFYEEYGQVGEISEILISEEVTPKIQTS
jgi:hypothetical protein